MLSVKDLKDDNSIKAQEHAEKQRDTLHQPNINSNFAISPTEALELLSKSYLNTLILDVCKEPCLLIPGSKYLKWVSRHPTLTTAARQRQDQSTSVSSTESDTSSSDDDDASVASGNSSEDDSDASSVWTSSSSNSALFDAGNGFAIADSASWNHELNCQRRVPIHVLVYDEDGLGHSSSVAQWLLERESKSIAPNSSCLSVQRIQGGIAAFLKEYPLLDKRNTVPFKTGSNADDTKPFAIEKSDKSSSIVIDEPEETRHYLEMLHLSHERKKDEKQQQESAFLGSLFGLPGLDPLESLKTWQKNLIDSVWFGKKDGDVPVPIIPEFLYLSSCYACTRQNLVSRGIKHVVRLGWGFQTLVEKDDNITFHDFRISDSPSQPIRQVLEETGKLIDDIHKLGEKVLVHCHAGVSRSSSVVLAYLMKFRQLSLYDSWNLTYKARPIIRPNYGFSRALQAYEVDLFGSEEPSLSSFWMSESYMGYIDYVEFMYRAAKQKTLF